MLRIRSLSACTMLLVATSGCNDAKRPESGASQLAARAAPVRTETPAQNKAQPSKQPQPALPDPLRGTVKETMAAGGYTYVLLATNQGDHWAAAKRFNVVVGNDVEVAGLMSMANFTSPALKKSFDHIQFVGRATVIGGSASAGGLAQQGQTATLPSGHPSISGTTSTPAASPPPRTVEIEVQPGSVTVAELFEKKAELNGKSVKFSGRVVKVNRGILGSNWLHVQDGCSGPAILAPAVFDQNTGCHVTHFADNGDSDTS